MIRYEQVNKWYGSYHALVDVTEEIARGEVVDGRVIVHGRAGGITTAGATVRVADIRAWPATWPPKSARA